MREACMELLLGIDIGTSSCKIAFFQKDGTVAASGTGKYPIYHPRPGWAEQDPRDWWKAVCQVTRQLIQENGIRPQDVKGIGVDGMSWAAVAVDKKGDVLARTPLWMDTRANEICSRVRRECGEDAVFQVSGNPLQPFYTTGKVLWYQEEMPEVYRKIYKILQCNSYLVYCLTGRISQDISQGYALHCFDMRRGCWDEQMREKLGIPAHFLPDIFPCHEIVGTVTKEAAGLTGLLEGTPVAAGGLDAACGTLGAGVLDTGETQEQGGQAGGMSICLKDYTADPRLILSYHVVPGRWLLQGGTTGGGSVMRWFEKEFADYEREMQGKLGRSSLEQLNDIAEEIPEGSDGLIFLPYMAGERSPIWDDDAKGVYYGMDFSKTKGHFVRAAMEGVAYALNHNLQVAEKAGAYVEELRAVGGSANSLLWTQIKADVTGKRIVVPSSDTATPLGAAILAGVGTGVYNSFEEAVEQTVKISRIHEPDPKAHETYKKYYEMYLELYDSLKALMKKTGGSQ